MRLMIIQVIQPPERRVGYEVLLFFLLSSGSRMSLHRRDLGLKKEEEEAFAAVELQAEEESEVF